jgi:2-polyprenyl-6-methoxyphenol hydroxylase-like FAD-dependent oxidoreductase
MTLPAHSQCVIAGGGPAGMTLGLLLARAGVRVTVLEKHRDFLRDFRGDTIHPSTMEILHELGLLERFLQLPHEKVSRLFGQFGDLRIPFADFSHLPVQAPFIAMMPQWDFLNFLATQAARYPTFSLRMNAEVTGLIEGGVKVGSEEIKADLVVGADGRNSTVRRLAGLEVENLGAPIDVLWFRLRRKETDPIEEGGRVAGVRATTEGGSAIDVRGDLVVAADGRHSVLRRKAGFVVRDLGAPIDVLWFRLSRQPDDTSETMGRFDPGAIMVMINRGTYWQCAYVIPKGGIEEVRARGLPAFRSRLAKSLPFPADRADEIGSWDDVKLLTVAVDRLEQWHKPGLLCIGDSAHAMSPIGGVGVNLAVQDAVAAANILSASLREGRVEDHDLAAVQKRRLWPTRVVQWLQLAIQNNVIAPTLQASGPRTPPLPVRLMARCPMLRRLPARLVGLGIRPEHVADGIRRAGTSGQVPI